MMTPVLRTRCTKAMNLKAHTQRALKRGDGNSNSKASKQPAQNHNVISSLGTTSTASSFDWAASLPLRPQVNEPDNGGKSGGVSSRNVLAKKTPAVCHQLALEGAAYGLPLCIRTYRGRVGRKLLCCRNLAVSSRNVLAKKTPAV
jgi:hypothetical protein